MALLHTASWLVNASDPTGMEPSNRLRPLSGQGLEELCLRADAHGVLPAVVQNLRTFAETHGLHHVLRDSPGKADLAEQFAARLQSADKMLRKRTAICMLIRRQADQLTAALGTKGIPVGILKGPQFADRLYPHPALRTFTDVDLLVPPSAVEDADATILDLGYRPKASHMKYAEGYGERSYLTSGPAGGAAELHWNLVNSPSIRRGLSVEFDDLQLSDSSEWKLSPASLMLIAAVHGAASHGFDRLQLLWDVCQAARGTAGEIDDDWLADTTRRCGAQFALAASLDMAGGILGEPRCRAMYNRLALPRYGKVWRVLLTRGVVLRAHAYRDSFRRCLFRILLKRGK